MTKRALCLTCYGLRSKRHKSDGICCFGLYKVVRVGVIKTKGKIPTIFSDSDKVLF